MGLAIAENQVEIAVSVQVEPVDALEYTSPWNVDIVPSVTESTAPEIEIIETASRHIPLLMYDSPNPSRQRSIGWPSYLREIHGPNRVFISQETSKNTTQKSEIEH